MTASHPSALPFRISALGSGGCLLDLAEGPFDDAAQRTVWAAARAAIAIDGVLEAVPGMNNLMLVFDPLRIGFAALHGALLELWPRIEPDRIGGRTVELPVVYGGAGGEDLDALAEHAGFSPDEVVRRHSAGVYTVAAIGAMPGFPYLSGLDPALAWGRRASPRASVAEGAVIIGGAQAGVMPVTAPSGWHIIGRTETRLFDPARADPVLLRPGDTIRFAVAGRAS